MLRYCAWCGQFQGVAKGRGHQIRKNVCEIDTTTICPACFAVVTGNLSERGARPVEAMPGSVSPV